MQSHTRNAKEGFSTDYRADMPEVIRNFLIYHETIKGHSKKTVDEYYLDLRTFFRYLKLERGMVPKNTEFESIPIADVDLELIKSVTLSDVYDFLSFLSRDKIKNPRSADADCGLESSSRARKISTLRSFFKYLTLKTNQLEENPIQDLDSPKIMKSLPKYLSLEECTALLESVDGPNRERDYCILTLFLNLGLRISELVGLNLSDIHGESIRVLGKGNKERELYLNDACIDAINNYLRIRKGEIALDRRAFFLSSRKTRISRSTVHALVKKYLMQAGIDSTKYSAHKLRHTAATLMLHNGVDVRTLQELLGHENLNTTQIYTHVENESLRQAAQLSPLSGMKQDGARPKRQKTDKD